MSTYNQPKPIEDGFMREQIEDERKKFPYLNRRDEVDYGLDDGQSFELSGIDSDRDTKVTLNVGASTHSLNGKDTKVLSGLLSIESEDGVVASHDIKLFKYREEFKASVKNEYDEPLSVSVKKVAPLDYSINMTDGNDEIVSSAIISDTNPEVAHQAQVEADAWKEYRGDVTGNPILKSFRANKDESEFAYENRQRFIEYAFSDGESFELSGHGISSSKDERERVKVTLNVEASTRSLNDSEIKVLSGKITFEHEDGHLVEQDIRLFCDKESQSFGASFENELGVQSYVSIKRNNAGDEPLIYSISVKDRENNVSFSSKISDTNPEVKEKARKEMDELYDEKSKDYPALYGYRKYPNSETFDPKIKPKLKSLEGLSKEFNDDFEISGYENVSQPVPQTFSTPKM